MGIGIVTLDAAHLPAVMRFSERTWDRSRRPDFCRWRYLDAPSHRTLLAMRGDECVAVVSVFSRPYRIGEVSIDCLETADWFCLPELRFSGLGVRLMRLVMEEPHPIVAVGGSADTLTLLPRLGWQRIGEASKFVLWLGPWAVGARLAGIWRRLRGLAAPSTGEAVPTQGILEVGEELPQLYRDELDCATVPLPIPDQLHWLAEGLEGRRLAAIRFRVGGRLRGWSLLRIDTTLTSREAMIVELFAPAAETPLYTWMVAETVALAAASGSWWIRARTACPYLRAALRSNCFRERFAVPIHVWLAGRPVPPGPLHVGWNTGDASLLPYPASGAPSHNEVQ